MMYSNKRSNDMYGEDRYYFATAGKNKIYKLILKISLILFSLQKMKTLAIYFVFISGRTRD